MAGIRPCVTPKRPLTIWQIKVVKFHSSVERKNKKYFFSPIWHSFFYPQTLLHCCRHVYTSFVEKIRVEFRRPKSSFQVLYKSFFFFFVYYFFSFPLCLFPLIFFVSYLPTGKTKSTEYGLRVNKMELLLNVVG